MADLDTLRPGVREAVREFDGKAYPGSRTHECWQTIRAELMRLADENADLTAQVFGWKSECGRAADWKRQAEDAEAELAEAQNTIAAQQGTMGALKRKLALAEAELAAVRETSMELSSTNKKLSNSSRYKPL